MISNHFQLAADTKKKDERKMFEIYVEQPLLKRDKSNVNILLEQTAKKVQLLN